jgi:DNA-directed RNA polymerase subunit beta'
LKKLNIFLLQLNLLKLIIPILLNRAPTLHKLSIQAFYPLITKNSTIKIHPLVCSAFNADFDGDQMGIHLPISLKSHAETRTLIISTSNCLLPANGKTNNSLTQDMVLGCFYLTNENLFLNNLMNQIF